MGRCLPHPESFTVLLVCLSVCLSVCLCASVADCRWVRSRCKHRVYGGNIRLQVICTVAISSVTKLVSTVIAFCLYW